MDARLSRNGADVDISLRLPFHIVNMIGAQLVDEASVLGSTMNELRSAGNVDAKDAAGSEDSLLSGGDQMIQAGMSLVAGDAEYNASQDTVAVRLVATSDPTVFRAFFCVNVGNMSSGGNVSGIYPDYGDTETMAFADTVREGDFDKFPNVMNIYRMINGSYLQNVSEEGTQAANGQEIRSFNFDLGGYFEADIYYDADAGGWACRPITGGIHGGGGLNYSWYVNTIEFVFKFLFVSYEKVLCSIGFNVAGQYGNWDTIEEIWAENKTINNRSVTRTVMPNGQTMYAIDLGPQLESRDYVGLEEQRWAAPANSLVLDDDSPLPDVLQTGAYSYANPVLSDDGNLLLYLSDRVNENDTESATDVTMTRAAFSKLDGGSFAPGTRLEQDSHGVNASDVPDGYGDSALRVAGNDSFAAAVWVRQMDDITPDDLPGGGSGELTDDQQMLQFNSTEIVAGIYQNSRWTLHQLTDNSAPDLAPVVATNGDRTIVVWREVNSTSVEGITNFDQQDAIRYAIYEDGKWQTVENDSGETVIDVQTLYDGGSSVEGQPRTGASVKGIEAAMMSDGTAAVVYTLDTGADASGNTDWETVAAILPNGELGEDQKSEDTIRTFQLTTDENLDENPQVAAVRFDDDTQRFVIAWHTERAVTADRTGTESDIRLAAMDKDGALYNAMPESLGRSVEGTSNTVGANFRFAKNADTIEDLAILWVDSVAADGADNKDYSNGDLGDAVSSAYQNYMGYDVLKAVKFVETGSTFTVSGAVEVASMQAQEDGTTKLWTIDAFDARMEGDQVKSVILGTNYDASGEKMVEISDGSDLDGTGSTATITVPIPVSRMFTASEPFQNQMELSAVALAYDEIYPGSPVDVQFTVRNSGMKGMTGLEIYIGDDVSSQAVYSGDFTESPVAPNRDVTVTAQIPIGAEIENVDYRIVATFHREETNTDEYTGKLYLDIPDVGVSQGGGGPRARRPARPQLRPAQHPVRQAGG